MILQKRFARRVVSRLEELGWTKAHLARQMDVDPPYLYQYLNGSRSPGLDVIERFAAALQIDAGDLLQSEERVSS